MPSNEKTTSAPAACGESCRRPGGACRTCRRDRRTAWCEICLWPFFVDDAQTTAHVCAECAQDAYRGRTVRASSTDDNAKRLGLIRKVFGDATARVAVALVSDGHEVHASNEICDLEGSPAGLTVQWRGADGEATGSAHVVVHDAALL